MSLDFRKLFVSTQPNFATPDTLFTVPATPASSTLRNCRIRFANTSSAVSETIKAWVLPAATGTATDDLLCLPETSVGALSYIDVDIPVMSAGDFLQAQSGAGLITASMLDGFIQT